jgi:hypothetical protein
MAGYDKELNEFLGAWQEFKGTWRDLMATFSEIFGDGFSDTLLYVFIGVLVVAVLVVIGQEVEKRKKERDEQEKLELLRQIAAKSERPPEPRPMVAELDTDPSIALAHAPKKTWYRWPNKWVICAWLALGLLTLYKHSGAPSSSSTDSAKPAAAISGSAAQTPAAEAEPARVEKAASMAKAEGHRAAAVECVLRRLQCKKLCIRAAGEVTDRSKPTSDAFLCARGCEDNYFICRQALDYEWRKGGELAECDSKRYGCRTNCVKRPIDFPVPISKRAANCSPVCEKGFEFCKAGEGYWLEWGLERERL